MIPSSSIVVVLVAATFTALVAGTARHARKAGARQVLYYSSTWKSLTKLVWLFPIGVAIAVVVSPPNPGEGWIAIALIGVIGGLNLVIALEVFRREIELDDAGISQRSAWSSPVTIAWKDVREVAWSATHGVVVRPARGREIRVSQWMSGLETLAVTFEKRLAHLPSVPGAVKKIRAHRL